MRSKLAVLLLLLPLKGASCMETELTEEESQITVEQIQGVIGMGSTPADVIVRWLQCTITLVFASDVQVEFHLLWPMSRWVGCNDVISCYSKSVVECLSDGGTSSQWLDLDIPIPLWDQVAVSSMDVSWRLSASLTPEIDEHWKAEGGFCLLGRLCILPLCPYWKLIVQADWYVHHSVLHTSSPVTGSYSYMAESSCKEPGLRVPKLLSENLGRCWQYGWNHSGCGLEQMVWADSNMYGSSKGTTCEIWHGMNE